MKKHRRLIKVLAWIVSIQLTLIAFKINPSMPDFVQQVPWPVVLSPLISLGAVWLLLLVFLLIMLALEKWLEKPQDDNLFL